MITHSKKQNVKAVGLISGGLDSTLAAKIIKDLGIDVHGVYFAMPWGCCDKQKAQEAAARIGIPFIVLQLDERYLEVVRTPRYGYGRAMNPCVDCRIHMFSRAAQYMRHIGAQFCFTGEVVGQRPKSQKRNSMRAIERDAGLEGRLLRPLSAKLLEPTIPEEEGLVDRNKLLGLSGRGRKPQIDLATQYNITEYSPPAGGCSLTDENFARRMKDTLDHGYRNFRETISLKWGRHLRLNQDFKAIVGRDNQENDALIRYAHSDDTILQLKNELGPTTILKGNNPSPKELLLCAGITRWYSRYRNDEAMSVKYWEVSSPNDIREITPPIIKEDEFKDLLI